MQNTMLLQDSTSTVRDVILYVECDTTENSIFLQQTTPEGPQRTVLSVGPLLCTLRTVQ